MLKKIVKIRNVGRFQKADAQGDQEFRLLTLIHAENGRGKTTLCDILRSLKSGDPGYLVGRQTLAQSNSPEVRLRMDSGNISFADGGWSETHSDIEIFDTTFVRENIYAGDVVEHEHKRNLFRVIVGDQGVTLARRVDKIDKKIREVDRDINNTRGVVSALAPAGMTADQFVALEPDPEVESKIQASENELAAVRSSEEIRQKAELKTLELPDFPGEFTTVLSKSIDHISADVEQRVKEHIEHHTTEATERWIEEGLTYVKDDRCPFCGQNLTTVAIVESFRSYFSEAYRDLKEQAAKLDSRLANIATETAVLEFDRDLTANDELADFWLRFVEGDKPTLDVGLVKTSRQRVVEVARGLTSRKVAAPLEPISPDGDLAKALERYADARQRIEEYNRSVEALNEAIRGRKQSIAGSTTATVETKLRHLQTVRDRYSQVAVDACQAYEKALDSKPRLEEEKRRARAALGKHNEQVITQFEARINSLLEQFGASFRISSVGSRYAGGRPSATYSIVINDTAVELGDESSPVSEPSFRNTLSAGDRSSLALAFFLARLEADSRLASKIVVFDDPFGSQDRSRRACTRQQICNLLGRAEQVVVLSHEPMFLRDIWVNVPSSETKTLEAVRIGPYNSVIREWNIKEETDPEFERQIRVLRKYVYEGRGDRRSVARTIRPVLEAFLRINSPGQLLDTEWLGDFIAKIRYAVPSEPLAQWQSILEELISINDFSKRYHHENWMSEPIDDGELTTFVKRTLAIVPAA